MNAVRCSTVLDPSQQMLGQGFSADLQSVHLEVTSASCCVNMQEF